MKESAIIRQFLVTFYDSYFDRQIEQLNYSEGSTMFSGFGTPTSLKQSSPPKTEKLSNSMSKKTSKAIDSLIDNVRLFGCFLADFAFYYYDIGNLVFTGATPQKFKVKLHAGNNPFISRNVISTFVMDWILSSRGRICQLTHIIGSQCDLDKLTLDTNIAKVLSAFSPSDIGIPLELLQPREKTDNAKSNNKKSVLDYSAIKPYNDMDSAFCKEWPEDLPEKPLMELLQRSDGLDNLEVTSCRKDSSMSEVITDFDPVPKINMFSFAEQRSLANASAIFSEMTAIGLIGQSHMGLTQNEATVLNLLTSRPEGDKELFEDSLKMFQKITKLPSPCGKLRVLAESLTCALREIRQGYAVQHPDGGHLIQVSQQVLISVLVYLILRSPDLNILVDYRLIKVYVLLDKSFINVRLVSMLKVAIKSITKMGIFLAKLNFLPHS